MLAFPAEKIDDAYVASSHSRAQLHFRRALTAERVVQGYAFTDVIDHLDLTGIVMRIFDTNENVGANFLGHCEFKQKNKANGDGEQIG